MQKHGIALFKRGGISNYLLCSHSLNSCCYISCFRFAQAKALLVGQYEVQSSSRAVYVRRAPGGLFFLTPRKDAADTLARAAPRIHEEVASTQAYLEDVLNSTTGTTENPSAKTATTTNAAATPNSSQATQSSTAKAALGDIATA